MVRRVLYVEGCRDGTVGGSHVSLLSMVLNLDRTRFQPLVVFYGEHHIADKLRAAGVEVVIFKNFKPFNFTASLARRGPLLNAVGLLLAPLQKFANVTWFFARPAMSYARFIRQEAVDIVHLNNSINSNHEWMLAARMAGVRLVSHERGISPRLSTTSRHFACAADRLVCISNQVRKALVEQGIDSGSAVVVYNGIDARVLRPGVDRERLKATYGIAREAPVIGVIGNIKTWKGQETVVRATAILRDSWPNIRCLLVGGSAEGDRYRERLENVIRELGIGGHVIFAGYQDEPADYLNAMDVVVHSSIEPEPFGRVNIEAMYLERPVVATNIGGPLEIFRDGKNGYLIVPGDPAALADRVSMLLRDPRLRQSIGREARRTVEERFTIEETVRAIQDLYDRIDKGERC